MYIVFIIFFYLSIQNTFCQTYTVVVKANHASDTENLNKKTNNVKEGATFTTTQDEKWTPPIGIPDPRDSTCFGGFDPIEGTIDQTVYCPNWPAIQNSISNGCSHNCYYVDNTSSIANDLNAGGYGTPDAPRRTIPTGLRSPGDYIYINAGTYPETGDRITILGTGTPAELIWIVGNPLNKPVLNRFIHMGNGASSSYIIIENIKFVPPNGYIEGRPTGSNISVDHIVVRNCEADGSEGDYLGNITIFSFGMSSSDNTSINASASYIVAYNNVIHDVGDWDSMEDAAAGYQDGRDPGGYYAAKNSHHHWVLDNTIYHSGADAIAGCHNVSATYPVEYYFIGRNTLYRNDENAIDLKGTGHVVISENTMYGPWTDYPGEAIILHYGAASIGVNEVAVIFNKIYNSATGISLTSGQNLDVVGNLFYNIRHEIGTYVLTGPDTWTPTSAYSDGAAVNIRGFTGTARIVNNTMYGFDAGFQTPNNTGTFIIHGNIFSNRANPNSMDIFFANSAVLNNASIDYNLFFPSANIAWGNTSARTLSYMQGIGQCVHCLEADPSFVDAPNDDFRIQSVSQAKNTSIEHTVYQSFQDTFGVNIRVDKNCVPRPQSSAWDIGAYEFIDSNGIPHQDNTLSDYTLYQNYPNPFNPPTTISFYIGTYGHTSLKVYDFSGRAIITLVDEMKPAGRHSIRWDGKNSAGQDVGNGVYFYQLKTQSGFKKTQKMILVR